MVWLAGAAGPPSTTFIASSTSASLAQTRRRSRLHAFPTISGVTSPWISPKTLTFASLDKVDEAAAC